MRHVIDNYLYNNQNTVLVVADLGKFPKMETTDRFFNVGTSETLLANVAIGLALTGKHVFIYSAANFLLYRAYEQIKLHIIGHSGRNKKNINITILNGGSGFCYAGCGIGHYLLDDLQVVSNLGINCYLPYDKNTTLMCLKKSLKNINYIRLTLDDTPNKITIHTNKNSLISVVTFGWIVNSVNDICKKYNINLLPIIKLTDILNIKTHFVLIYDNNKDNTLMTANCVDSMYLTNVKDFIGEKRNKILQKTKFTNEDFEKFILKIK